MNIPQTAQTSPLNDEPLKATPPIQPTGARRTLWRSGATLILVVGAVACQSEPPRDKGETLGEAHASPQRIASQVVVADEILWALGANTRKRVVAVSRFADDRRYTEAEHTWPDNVARLSGHGEQLISLAPDLVFLATFTSPELRSLLKKTAIPNILLDSFNGFSDYRRNVSVIAEAVGAPEQGLKMVAAFDLELKTLAVPQDSTRTAKIVSWVSGIVAGADTTFEDAATAAGLRNAPGVFGLNGHRRVAMEQIVVWQPDIVVTACGEVGCKNAQANLAGVVGISATPAGRSGNLFAVQDRYLYSTGYDMLKLVKALQELPAKKP